MCFTMSAMADIRPRMTHAGRMLSSLGNVRVHACFDTLPRSRQGNHHIHDDSVEVSWVEGSAEVGDVVHELLERL